jgi:hypothetical protein
MENSWIEQPGWLLMLEEARAGLGREYGGASLWDSRNLDVMEVTVR